MAGAGGEQIYRGSPAFQVGRLLPSPIQFFTTGEDHLRVRSVCSKSGVIVVLQGTALDEKGQLKTFGHEHTPNSDRTVKTDHFALAPGAVLNLIVIARLGTPRIGECYIIVTLVRGFSGPTFNIGALISGYVTGTQPLGWPGSPLESSIAGGGVPRLISGTAPGAGNEIAETVPTGARWELLAFAATLIASAIAGARRPVLQLGDASGQYLRRPQTGTIAPSTSGQCVWAHNIGDFTAAGVLIYDAPLVTGAVLLAGHVIRTVTDNLDGGDVWTDVRLAVREWLEAA